MALTPEEVNHVHDFFRLDIIETLLPKRFVSDMLGILYTL